MNCWPSGKYVNLLSMYLILGRGSFSFNYCLNSAWHGGDQFVVVKSTFVESKTSPSPKRFESESRPSPKRFESESRPSPKRFESKSSPSPNETVKTEKEKNNLLQNHILNY